MTSEIERIKILEGKISQIVEHFGRLSSENARLKEELTHVYSQQTMDAVSRERFKLQSLLRCVRSHLESESDPILAIRHVLEYLHEEMSNE